MAFDLSLNEETYLGRLSFVDPNYNFLGNSLNYSFSSKNNDKPDQGYENTILSASIGTVFEQYKDVNLNLGLNAQVEMI